MDAMQKFVLFKSHLSLLIWFFFCLKLNFFNIFLKRLNELIDVKDRKSVV